MVMTVPTAAWIVALYLIGDPTPQLDIGGSICVSRSGELQFCFDTPELTGPQAAAEQEAWIKSLLPPAREWPESPNPRITPGDIATTDLDEICASGGHSGSAYSHQHRMTSFEEKYNVVRRYGFTWAQWKSLDPRGEIDHKVPLCLGGSDTIANLWPQRDYHQKDREEAEACRRVCATYLEPTAPADGAAREELARWQSYFLHWEEK